MKEWRAVLAVIVFLGALILTGYINPESSTSGKSKIAHTSPDNFPQNETEIIISFDMEGVPLQMELIKPFKDIPSRAILRTRIPESELESSQDLHRVLMKLSEGDGKLGERDYRLICTGSPMGQRFRSIIANYGSYDCILIGMDWTLDNENKLITVRGNPVIQNLASQSQQ